MLATSYSVYLDGSNSLLKRCLKVLQALSDTVTERRELELYWALLGFGYLLFASANMTTLKCKL